MSQYTVTLLLGSNLGNTETNIRTAIGHIQQDIGPVIKQSTMLRTTPVEFASNNIFCNIAILIKTQFSPVNLLNLIKRIEFDMGRTKDSSLTESYEDRIIDIDVVRYENIIFECRILHIPHQKHLYERDFSRKLLLSIETH